MSMPSRVVVTGMGMAAPLGGSVAECWTRLLAGETARAPVTLFDVSGCRCREAAQAEIPALPGLPAKRSLARASLLAIAAGREALAQAGLLSSNLRAVRSDIPISVATTAGGMAFGEEFLRKTLRQEKRGRLRLLDGYQPQRQALDLREFLGLDHGTTILANACSSGANAIGHGAELIRKRHADCVLTGGFEALTELTFVGFDCLQALSTRDCRPFDVHRDGLMLGEGAAFLVLENEEAARERGARILCRLSGYGHSTDLHHLTQPDPQGTALVAAMQAALKQAGITPSAIGYLNAHGTATPMNDGAETAAYAAAFGPELSTLRVSSTKAALGHSLGAAGAIEAVLAILALQEGQAAPQINTRDPLPEIEGRLVQIGDRLETSHVLSVNLGFGGSNAALVFARAEADFPGRNRAPAASEASYEVGVLGMGAVSPAGLGIEVLSGSGHPALQEIPSLSDPAKTFSALRVDLSGLARWKSHPRLRRASPIAFFMAEAAAQALGENAEPGLGIVAAYGTGSICYSRRFFSDVIEKGQSFASPALFPETVYNSPTSHLAEILGASGACYSLAGDESAWAEALRIAALWLEDGEVTRVLVVGAEELDAINLEAYWCSHWMKRGFIASEGASALLLGRPDKSRWRIRIPARSRACRTPKEAAAAAQRCFADLPRETPVLRTAQHTWLEPIETDALREFARCPPPSYLGEAFAASAGWRTLQALARKQPACVPLWGLNHGISRLDLFPPAD